MPKQPAPEAQTDETKNGGDTGILEEGLVLDYITQRLVKETPKELVRQRVARAFFHEYGISVEDMLPDFPIPVGGRKKKADLAIFKTGTAKEAGNVRRIVVCRPEPKKNGHKGVTKLL